MELDEGLGRVGRGEMEKRKKRRVQDELNFRALCRSPRPGSDGDMGHRSERSARSFFSLLIPVW